MTPGFTEMGAKVNASALYDNPTFAWETRLKVQYESILLKIPGAFPNDQFDDVVLSTEGRLNSLSIQGGVPGGFRLVPFLQAAADSEVTPAIIPPVPPATTPTTAPRQALFREALGVAAYPGFLVKEVRVGAIVQHDATNYFGADGAEPIRNDVGAGLEWHVLIPLWKLAFTSDVDARYFIPDGDDTAADLALRAQLVHKLALPVSPTTALFVFVDSIFFVGKKPPADELGYSAIAGAGVTFGDLWRF